VLDWAEKVVEHGGLVFAPHATSKNIGLFAKGVCSNSPDIAKSEFMTGFDFKGNKSADVLRNPRSQFGDVQPAWFISGDTRGFDEVGKWATYLKLGSTPTLEGLRQAFLAPATRIRFPRHLESDWKSVQGAVFIDSPLPTWPRLTSVHVEGGFQDGLDVELGPGLNAIIGGKGTGKSALIETIRHVIEAPASKVDDLKKNRQRNFPANADCTIGFVDESSEAYEAKRSGGSTGARLFRSGAASDVHVGRRIQVRVFGQRELQGLVDEPSALLGFVAGQAGAEWEEVVGEEHTILGELSTVDTELQSLEQTVGKLGEKQDELNDLKERLERAKEQGVEELLSQSSKLETAARNVKDALAWPSKVEAKAGELRALLPYPVLQEDPAPPEGLSETLGRLAQAVETAAGELSAAVNTAEQALPAMKGLWDAAAAEQRDDLVRRLADAGIANPQELAGIQGDIAKLESTLAALPERQARNQTVSEERAGHLTRLGELRRKKSRLIEQAATRLNERLQPKVRVVIKPLADHEPLQKAIEAAVRSQSVSKANVQQLASQEPAVLVAAARSGTSEVEQLGVTASTAAKIADLKPSVLRTIEEADTPDGIDLQINIAPSGEEDWKSIHDLSPGQRSTALLALALTAGEEPLLIDQPEDDLDNRYIFAEVVQVLARVCQQRQVIVATHNANIPILGDAEMLVALDAGANKGRVLAAGGLETPAVTEQARHILEGGDEAFRARQRRYLSLKRT
jgi:ABC-type cobalamin/Fe3+-siderophores transport system ATPase subunit